MNLEDFLPHLLPDLPGCPDTLVKQQLLFGVIEFCQETHAWNEIQDPVRVLDKQYEVDVETPRGARVVAVKDVWASNRKLRPVTMPQLFELIPNWQTAEGSEPTYYNAGIDFRTIRIYPIPIGANRQTLTMRVAYAPEMSATAIPDELAIKYWDALIGGAKARLMTTPGKAWTNTALALYNRRLFEDGILKAKISALHDRVEGSLSVRPHPFA
jgi:hypothetical protein